GTLLTMSTPSGSSVPPSSGPVSSDPVSSSAIPVGPSVSPSVRPSPASAGGGSRGAAPEYRIWSWEYSGGTRRRGLSLFGVALVVIGIALFINQVNPAVDLGSIFLVG